MNVGRRIRQHLWHLVARATRHYYYEDFVRVYPDGVRFDRRGRARESTPDDLKNYLNHQKFYRFAAQFVRGKIVADVGCGSGYGCHILSAAGAQKVCGADISRSAIDFSVMRYSESAEFTVQGITDLKLFRDCGFDVTISSEVLEHIKEYGLEQQAMKELVRITKPGGLVVVATPNSELLGEHGFSFDEISELCALYFEHFLIFENSLVPFGSNRRLWDERSRSGRKGVVVSEPIVLSETIVPKGLVPEIKRGLAPGRMPLGHHEVDTSLLHNTHSWVVVGVRERA